METRKALVILVLALGLMVLLPTVSKAAPMGTAFTYQGHLYDANYVANGLFDFQFKLFDDPNIIIGYQLGDDVNKPDVDVIDAYFTVELDFGGSLFDGGARWLEIGVRPGEQSDPCQYTTLAPRQEVTPTPYALYAKTAGGSVSADSDWQISGSDMYSIPSGNVGIGTTSPVVKLDVEGSINTDSVYKIDGDTVLSIAGSQNTLVGIDAGANNTANYGTFVGYNAGYNNQGNNNTFLGNYVGYNNTTGTSNTFLGHAAGYNNTEGYSNTFSGYNAGFYNTTGHWNTFLGFYAGCNNTEGSYNTFSGMGAGYNNTTGNFNTFSGMGAGYNNTTENFNTFSGYRAGYNNTGFGNVFIGHKAGYYETGDNKLYIDNSDSNSPLIYGEFDNDILAIYGSLGIGTISPTEALDVNGTAKANAFVGDGSGLTNLSPDSDWTISDSNMYSAASGNVGIGTTNPLSKLSVGGDGIADTGVYGSASYIGVYGSGSSMGVHGSGNVIGVSGVSIDTDSYGRLGYGTYGGYFSGDGYFSGNVGIGTTSPQAKLHVGGTAGVDGIKFPDDTLQTTAGGGSASVPIGTVIDWWRPNSSFAVPDGYQICDGSVVSDAQSPFNGETLPDLRNRFVRGALTIDDIGQTGGTSTHAHGFSGETESSVVSIQNKVVTMGGSNSNMNALPTAPAMDFARSGHDHTTNPHNHTAYPHVHTQGSLYVHSSSHLPPYVMLLKIMRIR